MWLNILLLCTQVEEEPEEEPEEQAEDEEEVQAEEEAEEESVSGNVHLLNLMLFQIHI